MIANKRGQTLILFIILIPLIIMLVAFVIDVGLIVSENNRLREVTKNIIEEVIKNDNTEIVKKVYEKNDVDTKNLEVIYEENKIRIKNKIDVYSIFGGIIGISKYSVKIDMTGEVINGKLFIDSR